MWLWEHPAFCVSLTLLEVGIDGVLIRCSPARGVGPESEEVVTVRNPQLEDSIQQCDMPYYKRLLTCGGLRVRALTGDLDEQENTGPRRGI